MIILIDGGCVSLLDATLGVNLGLGEHIKVQLPRSIACPTSPSASKAFKNFVKASLSGSNASPRSYSPTSDPARLGQFELTVKQYEGGCSSTYLAVLSPGATVHMSRGWPLPAPWLMKRKPGRRVGLVAMGVGITEASKIQL